MGPPNGGSPPFLRRCAPQWLAASPLAPHSQNWFIPFKISNFWAEYWDADMLKMLQWNQFFLKRLISELFCLFFHVASKKFRFRFRRKFFLAFRATPAEKKLKQIKRKSFYQNINISKITDENMKNDYLNVLDLSFNILKECLDLLIIELPSEM